MLHCSNRQKIVKRGPNGSTDTYRCAMPCAITHRQVVDATTCSQCVLRTLQHVDCQIKPVTLYQQPIFKDNCLVYLEVPAQPPNPPDGFDKTENPWVFQSRWPTCAFLQRNNSLSPKGELIIKGFCHLLNRGTNCGICLNCKKKVEEVIDFPSLANQLSNYKISITEWMKHGFPTRDESLVNEIFTKHCSKCDWNDHGRCKGCGCTVSTSSIPVLNKIKMGNTHCPKNLW